MSFLTVKVTAWPFNTLREMVDHGEYDWFAEIGSLYDMHKVQGLINLFIFMLSIDFVSNHEMGVIRNRRVYFVSLFLCFVIFMF